MRHFIPEKYNRVEQRQSKPLHEVVFPTNPRDEAAKYFEQFVGKISFWSSTWVPRKPTDKDTRFGFYTHNFIPKHKMMNRMYDAFPKCKVDFGVGISYRLSHLTYVTTLDPYEWWEFKYIVTKALEDLL